jgi:hypothetical protein
LDRRSFLRLMAVAGWSASTGLSQAPGADEGKLHTADDLVEIAAADMPTVDASRVATTRYLSLAGLPDKKARDLWARFMSAHVNSLSRSRGIVVPVRVGEYLLRLDIADYGTTFAYTWELLSEHEPFLNGDEFKINDGYKDVEYGYWTRNGIKVRNGGNREHPDEVWVTTEVKREKTDKAVDLKRGVFLRTDGSKAAFKEIQKLIVAADTLPLKQSYTNVPVVDAIWFLYQTAIQEDRGPAGYYDFLGIKDLKSYEEVIGYVGKGIDAAFLEEAREITGNSTVTLPQVLRRIVHKDKVGGDYFFTLDSNIKRATDKNKGNPLRTLNDEYVFQAIETFGHLPNGFWATGLFNAKGERQDKAPDFIASDSESKSTDKAVHINLSCMRCHKKSGIKDVDGWYESVLNRPPNESQLKDPKQLRTIRQQYVENKLQTFFDPARARYASALFRASGMRPDEFSETLAEAWHSWAETPVTIERAARWLGVTLDKLDKGLFDQKEKVDQVLSPYRLRPPQAISVASFFEAAQRLRDAAGGTTRPFAVRERKIK